MFNRITLVRKPAAMRSIFRIKLGDAEYDTKRSTDHKVN